MEEISTDSCRNRSPCRRDEGGKHKKLRAWLLATTYRFASPEEQLVPCQCEVAGFPALDELPADLLLLQLPLDQRLPLLVDN